MTDTTLSLRDHSRPCEHPWDEKEQLGAHEWEGSWNCSWCPGGVEIVLRRGRAVRRTRPKGPYGTAEEFVLIVPSKGKYWVEVNDD